MRILIFLLFIPVNVFAYPFETGDDGVFYISSGEQLAKIQGMASQYIETGGVLGSLEFLTNPDMRYVLTNNIRLPDGWQPIGDSDKSSRFVFRGSFDGGGFEIYGLDIDDEFGITQGLFGRVEGGEIRNLVLRNSNIKVRGDYGNREFAVGILAGEVANSVITNIQIINGNINSTAPDGGIGVVGGLVGKAVDSDISYVRLKNIRLAENKKLRAMGGLAGYLHNSNITLSRFTAGEIFSSAEAVGGFVGVSYGSEFLSCGVNFTVINAETYTAGGFVGHVKERGVFENNHSSACINARVAGGFAGKISGENRYNVEFVNNTARGQVVSEYWAGGFAGVSAYAVIKNSGAYVDVAATEGGAGGFVGRLAGRGLVVDSYAMGNVAGLAGYVGGFVGEITNSSRIESSKAAGIVSGGCATGGFVGVISAIGVPNTISDSKTISPLVSGTGDVRRFAGRTDHDGVNGCFAYLGTVVITNGRIQHVIPSGFGEDGADVKAT